MDIQSPKLLLYEEKGHSLEYSGRIGGLLFGMDVAVISGADEEIQKLWGLSDFIHGQALASALYGTIIGALFGGIPAEKFGRKKVLISIGILFLISASDRNGPRGHLFYDISFSGRAGRRCLFSSCSRSFISENCSCKKQGKVSRCISV